MNLQGKPSLILFTSSVPKSNKEHEINPRILETIILHKGKIVVVVEVKVKVADADVDLIT